MLEKSEHLTQTSFFFFFFLHVFSKNVRVSWKEKKKKHYNQLFRPFMIAQSLQPQLLTDQIFFFWRSF